MRRLAIGAGVGMIAVLWAGPTAVGISAPPTVTSLSPASGSVAGGMEVTVKGNGFTQVERVEFGTTAGRSLRVLSSAKLTVVDPKAGFGVSDVRVVSRHGTSAVSSRDRFTYNPAEPTKPDTYVGDSAVAAGSLGCDTIRSTTDLPVLGHDDVTVAARVPASSLGEPETIVFALNHVGQASPFDTSSLTITPAAVATRVDLTFPSSDLANNRRYGWTVRATAAYDGKTWLSPTTAHCYFTVDNLTPDPPAVTSSQYPPESAVRYSSSSGDFQFCPGGSTVADEQVTEYQYSLDGAKPTSVSASTSSHCADPTLTAPAGANQLSVSALIPGGDESTQTTYNFWH